MSDANTIQIRLALSGLAQVEAGLKSVANLGPNIVKSFAGVGTAIAGLAGVGSVGAIAALGKQTIDYAGRLNDLSQRTGLAVKSAMILEEAFKANGLAAEQVGDSVSKMQASLAEAATQGGAASAALQGIGLQAKDLLNIAPEEQFQKIAQGIAGVTNEALRAKAAKDIFGKSGTSLLPAMLDRDAIADAQRALGGLTETIPQNIQTLDSIGDKLARLDLKAKQVFGGIFSQIGGELNDVLTKIEGIDLTPIGKKIGGFVNVAIDEFRAGRFAEFIDLSIQAGFESGIEGSGKIISRTLGDISIWRVVSNGMFTAINEGMKGFGHLLIGTGEVFAATIHFAGSGLVYAFKGAIEFLQEGMEKAINGAIRGWNSLTGKKLPTIRIVQGEVNEVPSFGNSLKAVNGDFLTKLIDDYFNNSTAALRELTGVGNLSAGTSARSALSAMINSRTGEQYGPPEAARVSGENVSTLNLKLELQSLELDLAQRLQAINARKGAVEANWLETSVQKYREKKPLLEGELQVLDEQIAKLEKLKATATDEERLQIDAKINGLRGQGAGVRNSLMGMGADPDSFSQQFASAFTQIQEKMGTLATNMAQTFSSVFETAISSISSGITGLIMRTQTWGQALANIGTSILTGVVQAFVQMGVRFIATQIMMAVVGKSIIAAAVAASAPIAAAQSAIWAVPATLATIATMGAAASTAPGLIAAANAITLASSVPMFADGGYTGAGGKYDVAGIVHRGEYVVPAEMVQRLSVPGIESMLYGGGSSPAQSSGPSPVNLTMGIYHDKQAVMDFLKSSEGRAFFVDISRQHAHEINRA